MDIEEMKVRIATLELLTHALVNAAASNSDSARRFIGSLDESVTQLLEISPNPWSHLTAEQREDVAQCAVETTDFIRHVPR